MKQKLQNLINEARKNKDNDTRIALQTVTATIQELETRENKTFSDDEILVIIKKEYNKFVEGAEAKGVDADTKEKYENQAKVLDNLLPKALDDSKYEGIAQDYIKEANATTMRDMGKVLGKIKKDFGIRVDMGKMSPIVKDLLNK